jgi:hypothetical protein
MSNVIVQIADQQRDLGSADPRWVNEQVDGRQRHGLLVCVQVRITSPQLNLHLTTPTCGSGFGGGRPPNRFEREVIELWQRHRLNTVNFDGGQVVSFLSQLRRLVA